VYVSSPPPRRCVLTLSVGWGWYHQTKRRLRDGIELGDKGMITEALAKAEALRQEWGDIDIPPEQFDHARRTLDIIQREEETLSGIRSALAVGGLHGSVGRLSADGVDVEKLQAALHLVQPATVRTKLGNALVTFAKVSAGCFARAVRRRCARGVPCFAPRALLGFAHRHVL
jgi:hypothetical protein